MTKERLFWSHSSRERRLFRWWSYIRGKSFISFEASWLSGNVGASIAVDEDWTASLGMGVFSLYLSWPVRRYRKYGEGREISIRAHNGGIWWKIWTDPNSWSSRTPKWRDGNFNVIDFTLGRSKCEHRTLEARDILVPMPERAYAAKAELQEWTWRRPRWFAKTIKRVQIDIPGGIPFPGKGENSWDCGDDATHSITTGPCRSIADGVGVLVGSVLRDRVRYGGWDNWNWQTTPPSDTEKPQVQP